MRRPVELSVILIICGAFARARSDSQDISTHRSMRMIENSGLIEFSPDLVRREIPSREELARDKQLEAILSQVGDAKNMKNNQEAVDSLGPFITQFPTVAAAYLLRATLEFATIAPRYELIMEDLNQLEILKQREVDGTEIVSMGQLYEMRAKVNLSRHRDEESVADLAKAIESDPSSFAFSNGGVKPEEDTGSPGAFQEKDFDYLASKYPTDFRVFMARSVFFKGFTLYSETNYAPAFADISHAAALNRQSATVEIVWASLFQRRSIFTVAAARDISEGGGFKDQQNKEAVSHLERATSINPKSAEAWYQEAESLYSLKRFKDAIARYDKALELDPKRWGAYNDRGLAKFYIGNYYPAIEDFTKALEVKKDAGVRDNGLDDTYESRADAYAKVDDYDAAATDYGRAIGLHISSTIFLMSLQQIRAVYPEFANLPDDELLEGLREKFYPNMNSADFAGQYRKNTKPHKEFVLAGLYENRGDAYLGGNDLHRAKKEYSRAFEMDSDFEIDRWKLISSGTYDKTYLDIQTVNFDDRSAVGLWVKTVPISQDEYLVDRYSFDCTSQRMRVLGFVKYDSTGQVKASDDSEGNWQLVIPDSIGERFFRLACAR